MRKGTGASGFGNPKPLPGQAGYKVSETSVLEKDAKDMESRLQMLQDRLRRQQMEADSVTAATVATGGTGTGNSGRWKSARPDKGSIRSYAKDVQDKHQRKKSAAENSSISSTNMRRSGSAKQQSNSSSVGEVSTAPARPSIQTKDAEQWDVQEVSQWLHAVGLSQYVSSFAQNEIAGAILLDITLEDLDYMGITALGHRKTILKGVEELRQRRLFDPNNSVVAPKSPVRGAAGVAGGDGVASSGGSGKFPGLVMRTQSNPAMQGDGTIGEKSAGDGSGGRSGGAKKAHWSHLEPLSSKEVSNPGGGSFVNPADGDDGAGFGGVLDEAAERRAFQEAVAEWRRGSTVQDPASDGGGGGNSGDGGGVGDTAGGKGSFISGSGGALWNNPFAPMPESGDSGDVGGGSNGGAAAERRGAPTHPAGSAADLDEEAERRAFQAAVADWRAEAEGGAGGKMTIVREYLGERVDSVHVGGGGVGSAQGKLPRGSETADSGSGSGKLATAAAATTTLSGNRDYQIKAPSTSGSQYPGKGTGGTGVMGPPGGLLDGALDEEREHAEFVRAVNAWRRNKSGGGGSSAAAADDDDDDCATPAAQSSDIAQSLAAQLAEELEAAQRAATERLKRQKEVAQSKIQETNSEIEKIRATKLRQPAAADKAGAAESPFSMDDSLVLGDDDDEDEVTNSSAARTCTRTSGVGERGGGGGGGGRGGQAGGYTYTYSSKPSATGTSSGRSAEASPVCSPGHGPDTGSQKRTAFGSPPTTRVGAGAKPSRLYQPDGASGIAGADVEDGDDAHSSSQRVSVALVESVLNDTKHVADEEDEEYLVIEADSEEEEEEDA